MEMVEDLLIRFTAFNPECVPAARDAIRSYLQEAGLDKDRIDEVLVGVGEGITNVIKHSGDRVVLIRVSYRKKKVTVHVFSRSYGLHRVQLARKILAIRRGLIKCQMTEKGGGGLHLILGVAHRVRISRRGGLSMTFSPRC